jgi:hypothetical protein
MVVVNIAGRWLAIYNYITSLQLITCIVFTSCVATPLLEECEDETHTLEMGIWESTGTLGTLKFDYKG